MIIVSAIEHKAVLEPAQALAGEGLELGIHNGTVAITVAAGIATILASPAAVYSVFMFFTAGAFARVIHARNVRAEQA